MHDELEPGEALARAVSALKTPAPLVPGIEGRMRRRARRRRHTRLLTAGVATILAFFAGVRLTRTGTRVTFELNAPAVQSVALVGDFTDWQPDRVRLQRDASGEWRTTLRLPPGRYRFAYVVDHAEWRADSHAIAAPDDFGRPTSIVTVSGD